MTMTATKTVPPATLRASGVPCAVRQAALAVTPTKQRKAASSGMPPPQSSQV